MTTCSQNLVLWLPTCVALVNFLSAMCLMVFICKVSITMTSYRVIVRNELMALNYLELGLVHSVDYKGFVPVCFYCIQNECRKSIINKRKNKNKKK